MIMYEVECADRDTGISTPRTFVAHSRAEATAQAAETGHMVGGVREVVDLSILSEKHLVRVISIGVASGIVRLWFWLFFILVALPVITAAVLTFGAWMLGMHTPWSPAVPGAPIR